MLYKGGSGGVSPTLHSAARDAPCLHSAMSLGGRFSMAHLWYAPRAARRGICPLRARAVTPARLGQNPRKGRREGGGGPWAVARASPARCHRATGRRGIGSAADEGGPLCGAGALGYVHRAPRPPAAQDAEAQIVDLQRQLAAQPPGPKAEKVQADLRSRLLAARSHKAALESRLPTFSFEPGFAECMAIAKQFPIRPAPDGAERPGAPEDAAAAAAAPAFPTSPASGSGSTPDTSPRRLAPPAALTPGKQPQSAAQGGSPAPGRAAQALSPGKMLRFPFLAPGPAPPSPSTPGAGSPGAPLLKSPGQRPTRIVTSPPPPPLTRDELTSPIVFRCDADRALPDAGLGSDDEPGPRVGTPMSPASGGESPTRWRPASGGESPTFSRPRSRGRRAHPRALAASADNHRALSSLPRKRRENSVGLLQLPLVSPESVAMPDIGEIIQKKSWCAGQFSRERDRDMLKFRAATP